MFFISYDFSSDKTRAKFSKFLKKHGRRIQYSVFEIKNSPRIMEKILNEINTNYQKLFTISDSVLVWSVSEKEQSKIHRFGWSLHDEEDLVVF